MVKKIEKNISWYESKTSQRIILTIGFIVLAILFTILIIRGIIIYS